MHTSVDIIRAEDVVDIDDKRPTRCDADDENKAIIFAAIR